MFIPHSYPICLTFLLVSMVCWGSWPNTYKLTPSRRFEFYYLDFAIGIFLMAMLICATMGTVQGSPTAWQDMLAASWQARGYALVAGGLWNVGNVLLVIGIARLGIAIAFPISIGLALVVSTLASYAVMPRGNPWLLFPGIGCVFFAVLANARAYSSMAQTSKNASGNNIRLCILGGLLISTTGPLVGRALSAPNPLSPYGVTLLFTLAAMISTLPIIGYMARLSLAKHPTGFRLYWEGSPLVHFAGLLGGGIFALGTAMNFIAAGSVGVAVAIAIGQANPLIAALWGVFVWQEFRGASARSKAFLGTAFLLYLVGLLLLAISSSSNHS